MCQCYTIALRDAKQYEIYSINGLDTCDDLTEECGELVEDLEAISMNDGNQDHMAQIGSKLDPEIRKQLVSFL